MSLATAKSLNLWCKEGPSKLSYPLVCFSWLGSVKLNNMDQKWHCQISRYEAWKKIRCCLWYNDGTRLCFHGSLKCTPWYLYGILWYMSKNMVIHGMFCTKWCQDRTQKFNMDKLFHVFHIFGPGSVI